MMRSSGNSVHVVVLPVSSTYVNPLTRVISCRSSHVNIFYRKYLGSALINICPVGPQVRSPRVLSFVPVSAEN